MFIIWRVHEDFTDTTWKERVINNEENGDRFADQRIETKIYTDLLG